MRALSLGLFATLLLALLAVQIQQRLFRHRAERLLADFQSIRLHQTTWAEAQTIMHRWGAWGRPEGPCTQAECKYNIVVGDTSWRIAHRFDSTQAYGRLMRVMKLYSFLGGRFGSLEFRFIVQDGMILRDHVLFHLMVLPSDFPGPQEGAPYPLLVDARATDRLVTQPDQQPVYGFDSQLADHPDFKVGGPTGCLNCLLATITFTPNLSQAELRRLTAYDLSCFTRRRACVQQEDVLPAYSLILRPNQQPDGPPRAAQPCRIAIYARARDAEAIISVTVRTVAPQITPKLQEAASVQVQQVVKGAANMQIGQTMTILPYTFSPFYPDQAAEHLLPGHHFLIFLRGFQPNPDLESDFCDIIEDSPEARAQVARGIAQNDMLRHPERFTNWFW